VYEINDDDDFWCFKKVLHIWVIFRLMRQICDKKSKFRTVNINTKTIPKHTCRFEVLGTMSVQVFSHQCAEL